MSERPYDLLVVGAGVSGLTAAALAAREGARVVALEAHALPGGCAAFYQRDGFRFDVGATLAGGFGEDSVHARVFARLGVPFVAERIDPAMVVHLPGCRVTRYGDRRWETERRRAFGEAAEPFWRAQERVADVAWRFAAAGPPLPRDPDAALRFVGALRPSYLTLLPQLGRSVASRLPAVGDRLSEARSLEAARLRRFVDAQLLITAQGAAETTDWLYGATALDLAREGVYHLPGGIGEIAVALARGLRAHGGEVRYRRAVRRVERVAGGFAVVDETGERRLAERVIAAIPPADLAPLLAPDLRARLRRLPEPEGYGAFMAYVGLPEGVVPDDLPAHHQLVEALEGPMGEGRTAFLSFSTPGDARRARRGGRAVTISTHTDPRRWLAAYAEGRYEAERAALGARLLAALDRVVPEASRRAAVVEFGTPHTFERYVGRSGGYVGGAAQRPWRANLLAPAHRSGVAGLFLGGDAVFPGQSTVGAALSGRIAAQAALSRSVFRRAAP